MAFDKSTQEYQTPLQNNYGWGLTLDMTGKAPAISKRIFERYSDLMAYVNDANESAVSGLILRVVNDGENNGAYFVDSVGQSSVTHKATKEEADEYNETHKDEIANGELTAINEGDTIIDSPETSGKVSKLASSTQADSALIYINGDDCE